MSLVALAIIFGVLGGLVLDDLRRPPRRLIKNAPWIRLDLHANPRRRLGKP